MKQILVIVAMFSLATQLGTAKNAPIIKKNENSFVLPVIMTMEN